MDTYVEVNTDMLKLVDTLNLADTLNFQLKLEFNVIAVEIDC